MLLCGECYENALYSQEALFCASGTHFCSELSEPHGLVRECLGNLKEIHAIGARTSHLQACGIVP
jgi:hypothetical protein